MNFMRTALLLAALTAFFLMIGFLLGGRHGLMVALVVALGMNLFAYWNSDKMVLRMAGAREVGPHDAPELYGIVEQLARNAGLPMPKVYVIDEDQPNAFATGRSPEHAAVAVNTGLLRHLSREEVTGVLAHELGHVRNRDTLTMTVAATIGGAISMLAQWLQFSAIFGGNRDNRGGSRLGAFAAMLLAPFAAMLVQMAISRSREYQADRLGGTLCGNPLWLASALQKIESAVHQIPNPEAERVPTMASLYIVNPLTGGGMDSLFSTHPNIENRIAALEALAQELGVQGAAPSPSGYSGSAGTSQASGRPAFPGLRPRRGPWG